MYPVNDLIYDFFRIESETIYWIITHHRGFKVVEGEDISLYYSDEFIFQVGLMELKFLQGYSTYCESLNLRVIKKDYIGWLSANYSKLGIGGIQVAKLEELCRRHNGYRF